ncbi:MocR-like pyridoxine biosynthesis transcription factor PdxR [Alkaliphilus oremlandii]|uniref:Putative transcriptional regulator, GntR family n=1 Tax=Alkaliphilus oremlandii (strain OhILAs) TaxID=350688 RepID=A8MEJ2_ALKOO|nr:PLP-dependent aminotransferase family protein [Alkaliphilus oremlandii]ABW18321.1 putative transcriptional regulator, GntR family [Alkaliphilus oremlandii OhILAs]
MIYINEKSEIPIYQQIYAQIKEDIIGGALVEGDKLASTRVLAKELCVSRNTVENSYSQLSLEGYVESIPGSGFIVKNINEELFFHPSKISDKLRSTIEAYDRESALLNDDSLFYKYNFQYGSFDDSIFPYSLWRRLTAQALLSIDSKKINFYNDKQGELDLRIEIMNYLKGFRGVSCTPEQIVICSGNQHALDLICKIFSKYSPKIAIEEPGYDGARIVFENNNFEINPIPVQSDGINIVELEKSSAKLVYITPSHQFPTGVIMPIQNRIHLLHWATQNDGVIIEDDYDSEFRYHSRPIPSLQSIDQNERVIYLGTFSKALSPGLRMSYMILPKWLLSKYNELFNGYYPTVPWLQQKILSLYMSSGHWERYLRKARLSYKRKHDILVQTLTNLMGDQVIIHGNNAGLHIVLEFVNGEHEDWLIEIAKAHKIKVYPISPFWYIKESYSNNMILLGFSMLNEEEIIEAITLLEKAWFHHFGNPFDGDSNVSVYCHYCK